MTTTIEELDRLGIDPLLDGRTVRAATGNPCRETHSRRVSRGEFPPPDRRIGGRNFWFRSTVQKALAGDHD